MSASICTRFDPYDHLKRIINHHINAHKDDA